MTPADAKDWWLAAAALSTAFISSAHAQDKAAGAPEKAGIVSAMTPGATSATGNRVLYVGGDAFRGEKLITDATGTLHILFMDQSSMTLGPNSEVTLDEFVYDPGSKRGKIGVSLGAGLLRVVGGQISKNTETTVKTASGTIGIRGGISVVESSPTQTSANFLFGQAMSATDTNGNTQTVTRPGFGVTDSGGGFGGPQRTPPTQFSQTLAQFDNRSPGATTAGTLPGTGGGLISTGDRPNPNIQTISADRLNTVVSTTLESNPSATYRPTQQSTTATQNEQRVPPISIQS
jgi:hypothetical protein